MRFILCLFLISTICVASTHAQTPDSARIKQARVFIDSSNAKWCEAHRKGDAKLLGSLFLPDGALLLRNGRILQGPENIEPLFANFFQKNGTFEMTITTLDVWIIDSLAYELGKFTQKSLDPKAEDTTTNKGGYFEIWKQLPDGRWKILRDAGTNRD